ncbi:MAG: GspMb/PilO family protein [Isosphaeraceae bacterium]
MSNTSAQSASLDRIADSLRQPLRLRLVLCPVILGAWYFLFFSPLSDNMTATEARIGKERKRIAAARQVEQGRKALEVYKGRVPGNSDPNELMQFVMTRIRGSPLKLIDIKPARSKTLGPYDAIGLQLSLEGTYSEVHELLNWIHHEKRLLRVESLSLAPARVVSTKHQEKGPVKLAIQLVLAGLMDRTNSAKPPAKNRG